MVYAVLITAPSIRSTLPQHDLRRTSNTTRLTSPNKSFGLLLSDQREGSPRTVKSCWLLRYRFTAEGHHDCILESPKKTNRSLSGEFRERKNSQIRVTVFGPNSYQLYVRNLERGTLGTRSKLQSRNRKRVTASSCWIIRRGKKIN